MESVVLKFIKFGIVGASGIAVDFAITYVLKEKVRVHKYTANSIGFISAASYNYTLNRMWTFASTNTNIMNEYFSFILVSVIGLAINSFVLWFFVNRNVNFYTSKLIAVAITMNWNFCANLLFTFNK